MTNRTYELKKGLADLIDMFSDFTHKKQNND